MSVDGGVPEENLGGSELQYMVANTLIPKTRNSVYEPSRRVSMSEFELSNRDKFDDSEVSGDYTLDN